MMTEQMSVEDYKDLIDRGWRRSGTYCYKPTLDKTCCPQYTIRCDAIEFTLNKSHKKIIKKFNKFLNDGIFIKSSASEQSMQETSIDIPGDNKNNLISLSKLVTEAAHSSDQLNLDVEDNNFNESYKHRIIAGDRNDYEHLQTETHESKNLEAAKVKSSVKNIAGPDPNKPPCKKAKLLRLERRKEKMIQKGVDIIASNKNSSVQKSLEQFLEGIPISSKHKLQLKLIPTSTCGDDWKQTENVEFELYKKYQMIVHNDPPEKLHTRNFKSFLVSSPLKPKPFPNGIDGPGYGSFHQQYWLDDKLIAVAVIDILPGCVSSVYFFYDPDYRDLTLGTYGSLREIQLVRSLYSKLPDMKYYYMGFYIHSCPKMRYKGKLNPSDLLCPETYQWFPIQKCLEKLNVSKYARFNDDIHAIDANACSFSDIEKMKIVHNHQLMYAKDFIRLFDCDTNILKKLGELVGKRLIRNMVFWIDIYL